MKRTTKILILLTAAGIMCCVAAGFLSVFRDAFAIKPRQTVSLPTETVYYAPLETEETVTEAPTEPPETLPPETVPETTAPEQPDRIHYDAVPNFYETDYPDIRYGIGSFAENGSGITSVAMVASYLTGYEYRPDQLAQ